MGQIHVERKYDMGMFMAKARVMTREAYFRSKEMDREAKEDVPWAQLMKEEKVLLSDLKSHIVK